MSSSMTGSTGYGGGSSTGSFDPKQRGLDPRMKHISGHHRFQQFTPEQMGLLQQMMGMIGPDSFLSKIAGGDEEAFAQMEAPALRQFSGLQGNLASRFSGMGMGARNSSGFQNAAGAQSSDFAQKLQSQRMGLQSQATRDLMQMAQMLMGQQPYGLQEKQAKKPSDWTKILGLFSPVGGDIASGGETNYTAQMLKMMMGGM